MYPQGRAIWHLTALQALGWMGAPQTCPQPPGDLPGDPRLPCVLVALPEIQGMSGLQVRGGGVNRAPEILGGGVGKRAQLTGTVNQLL